MIKEFWFHLACTSEIFCIKERQKYVKIGKLTFFYDKNLETTCDIT